MPARLPRAPPRPPPLFSARDLRPARTARQHGASTYEALLSPIDVHLGVVGWLLLGLVPPVVAGALVLTWSARRGR